MTYELKDDMLNGLAQDYNIARFVSVSPNGDLRHLHTGTEIDKNEQSLADVVTYFIALVGSVNIRTFKPGQWSGNPFSYGFTDAESALKMIKQFTEQGYYCIVNETIDTYDGGVSGVIDGGIVEFAPDDTPRCVEKPGVCTLALGDAEDIFAIVYGEYGGLPLAKNKRIEFSIHPNKVGTRHTRTLIWEVSDSTSDSDPATKTAPIPTWPNRFSQHIGDKVFGLLIADIYCASVPRGIVVGRRVAPFRFGDKTRSGEQWIRTCPVTQQPGKYTTTSTWTDPYELMHNEDPNNTNIQSIIFQESVDAAYSGATQPLPDGKTLVEGVKGKGNKFMEGEQVIEELPDDIISKVIGAVEYLEGELHTRIRIEWVADADGTIWVVQLHNVGAAASTTNTKDVGTWIDYDPELGLDALRELIPMLVENSTDDGKIVGINVTRPIGTTSHVGDLLRKNNIPFRISNE